MYMRAVVEENKPAIEFETLANLSAFKNTWKIQVLLW